MALDSSKTLFPAALPIAKKTKPNFIKPNLVKVNKTILNPTRSNLT